MYVLISILKAPGPNNFQLLKKKKKEDTFPLCNHFDLVPEKKGSNVTFPYFFAVLPLSSALHLATVPHLLMT